jgi:hypothetical protein
VKDSGWAGIRQAVAARFQPTLRVRRRGPRPARACGVLFVRLSETRVAAVGGQLLRCPPIFSTPPRRMPPVRYRQPSRAVLGPSPARTRGSRKARVRQASKIPGVVRGVVPVCFRDSADARLTGPHYYRTPSSPKALLAGWARFRKCAIGVNGGPMGSDTDGTSIES